MSTLFARARAYQPLTPAERAVLKLVEGFGCVALVAALPVVAGALGSQSVNWGDVARTALAAASVAVLLALAKYAKAQGDPALAAALGSAAGEIGQQAGLSDSGEEPILPPEAITAASPASPASPMQVAEVAQVAEVTQVATPAASVVGGGAGDGAGV